MSQFHKPRETDYYLRIPTELVFVQVSIALSLHVLCSLSRWRCCPSELIRLLSKRSAKWLHASIFSPSCPYTACVCVCVSVCFHHTITVRVLQVFIEFVLPNLSQHMSAHSSRPITALSPFVTSANLNFSVRWFSLYTINE